MSDKPAGVLEPTAYKIGYWLGLRLGTLDNYSQGFLFMLWRSWENFTRNGTIYAASLSYYALFSMFPLLLLMVIGIGKIVGPTATGDQLDDFLKLFLPGATAIELSNTIERFVRDGGSASVVAVISLLWSGVGLFANLEMALSRTFRDTDSRPFLKRRIAGIGMIVALGMLLIANLVTSFIFSVLGFLFINQTSLWLSITSIFVPFGFGMGIFAMMYRWIPRTPVGWDAIWPAALVGATLWEVAKRGFGVYLDQAGNLSLIYGSITTVIIFMLWAYYTASIILLCAEFCRGLADWLEEQRQRRGESPVFFAGDYYERTLILPLEEAYPQLPKGELPHQDS